MNDLKADKANEMATTSVTLRLALELLNYEYPEHVTASFHQRCLSVISEMKSAARFNA
jgi:hypothetical protein